MAVTFVVAVHDSAMDAFSRPFHVPTTQAAVRSFSDEVNRVSADNPLNAHPDDFILYHLAMFEDESGRFENLSSPAQLVRAKDVVVKKGA